MPSIYDNFSFRILAKNSASPTLVVIVTPPDNAPYVMKVWNAESKTVQEQGLDYERAVYQTQINSILQENPDAPFLKYVEDGCDVTVTQMGEQIGISNEEGWNLWKTVLYIYLNHPFSQFTYDGADIEAYSKRHRDIKKPEVLDRVNNIRLKCIMLPFVKFRSLSAMVRSVSTARLFKYVKQIIRGIKMIYDKGVVHNDLHLGNIMIEEKSDNVLIFDWDRSYVKGINNPLLNPDGPYLRRVDCCTGRCSSSQCNVFSEGGYSTDLYKVLYYILRYRHDDKYTLLKNVFHVYNRTRSPLKQSKIVKKLTENAFFKANGCTYLQCPDKKMKYVHFQFGTIDEVYIKSQAPEEENKAIPVINHMRKAFTSTIGYLAKAEGSHGVGFSFKRPVTFRKTTLLSGESSLKLSDPLEKLMYNIKQTNSIAKQINYLKNVPENKATFKDLMAARSTVKYLTEGSIIKSPVIMVKGSPDPPLEYITSIIQKNDLRKYGKGQKLL